MSHVQFESTGGLLAKSVLALPVSVVVLVAAHANFLYRHDRPFGYSDLPTFVSDLTRPSIMVAGTFLGILFSLLIKQLLTGDDSEAIELKTMVSKRRLLLAALLSPLVLAAVYAQLVNLPSAWLVFLIAYQNGYFWESLLSSQRPPRKTPANKLVTR